jgi:hypothetical protein
MSNIIILFLIKNIGMLKPLRTSCEDHITSRMKILVQSVAAFLEARQLTRFQDGPSLPEAIERLKDQPLGLSAIGGLLSYLRTVNRKLFYLDSVATNKMYCTAETR